MVFTPAVYAEKRIFGTITLPRAKSIFKAKMVLMTNKFMFLWTTISSSIGWDQYWLILTTLKKISIFQKTCNIDASL